MKNFILSCLFLISNAWGGEIFISQSFYEAAGDKFRVEMASSFEGCKESKKARKIFLDKTNELREIAYWNEEGKISEAGPTNNPALRLKVEEVFAKRTTSENPCRKEEVSRPAISSGSQASQQ